MKTFCLVMNLAAIATITVPLIPHAAEAQITSSKQSGDIFLRTPLLGIDYHGLSGTMDVQWKDGTQITGMESGAQLADGQQLLTSAYATHIFQEDSSSRGADGEREFTIIHTAPGKPVLMQHIYLSETSPSFSIQVELDGSAGEVASRHFDAVVIKGSHPIQVAHGADLRVLHVPFDNDMWFRFKSEPVAEIAQGETFSSDEVTAVYDNATRGSVVLGSIDHSTWKTAIDLRAERGHITSVDVYGGITSPTGVRTDTHDTVPHGLVHGEKVLSPRIFVGAFSDWRDGLEAYGDANAKLHPALDWPGPVPMGWNSWAAYADKIDYQKYLGAAKFMHDTLLPEGFSLNKVLYINLDAFWSRLDAVQLADAVATIKGMKGEGGTQFEPGIYWTPFAYWSDDLDAWVEGTGMKYRYRDILLKAPDGTLLPKVDGGRPIDPTHPGTKERTDYFMKKFQQMGFSYLKLDFLSHGSLEGRHFDPAIQTGIEAYNEGMQQIVDANANHMFLSLSIAPLFPAGYGHARRLSCDTKGHINGREQSTEYMLNSLTYGWWTNRRLYIADPDHVVLGEKADLGARSVTEGASRLLSAIIASGMILDSSRLADDEQGRELAQKVYNSRNLFAVAEQGRTFRPLEGDNGDMAASAFVAPSPHGFYLAVFNYDEKQAQEMKIPLDRIASSLGAAHLVSVRDVAAGQLDPSARDILTIQLQPAQSKLLELIPAELPSTHRLRRP